MAMETSGLEPEMTTCKIAALPIKLCPLFLLKKVKIHIKIYHKYTLIDTFFYPRNDLNVHEISSVNFKFTLSTNSSTRIYNTLFEYTTPYVHTIPYIYIYS